MTAEVRPDSPLERLLGGKAAKKLDKEFGIGTAGELLDHYPRRYIEYGQLSSFADLREEEHVTFIAQVVHNSERRMQRRRGILVEVIVEDSLGGRLKMAFFQGWNARRQLLPGVRAMFHGRVGSYAGQLTLNNPEFTVLSGSDSDDAEDAEGDEGTGRDEAAVRLGEGSAPVPLYPAKAGLSSWEIHRCVQILLDLTDLSTWPDPLPEEVRTTEELPGLAEAYRMVHRPEEMAETGLGFQRLRFQEAFLLQALLTRRRQQVQETPGRARPLRPGQGHDAGLLASFDAQLPFTLTEGQRRCGELIAGDLAEEKPMNRLLQGEVGSGKTLVALRAMLQVVDAGGQAALIAPTEVLAAQHERSLRRMLGELDGVTLSLLTGSMSTSERKRALLGIASGEADLVVGTHAVLGEQVHFADLGLVVIDEQHRFGVEQRNALRSRYETTPHMLVMSATPIPRSVAMTVFGDLELTVLEGLPGGRQPIETHLAQMTQGPRVIGRVWERIAEEVATGHQVYVVCPKISQQEQVTQQDTAAGAVGEEMDRSGVDVAADASVELMSEKLAEHPLLKGLRRASLHGRMDAEATEQTMRAFERGEIDILISTTVIEVGVDVPNATVMAILDADAFGVSTLHQLRGRVGRGSAQGLCLLVTRLPEAHPSMERLREVVAHRDGMALARLDLERRREGDVLGASQAGKASSLKLLRVSRHEEEIARAAEYVRRMAEADPQWSRHPALRETVDAWIAENERAEEFIQHG